MITDMDSETFTANRHPDENELLLALEHELSARAAAQVEEHLGNCWSCRARSDELRRGILAFVEYREKRYLPSLPAPPPDHRNFPRRLREAAGDYRSPSTIRGALARFCRIFSLPWRFKWVSLVATTTAMIFFWVEVIAVSPSLTAAELLSRAAASQEAVAVEQTVAPSKRRTVHQKVRIRSAGRDVIQEFEWSAAIPAPTRWNAMADPAQWDIPLTVSAFAAWRDSVHPAADQIKRWGDQLTLTTTTNNDRIAEARLTVRYSDFHPIRQHIHFVAGGDVSIEEIGFEISEDAVPAPQPGVSAQNQRRLPNTPKLEAPVPQQAGAAADLQETEFQIRFLMFERQWDLDEDLTISRTPNHIVLTGTASSAERAQEIESVIEKVPGAEVSVVAPQASQAASALRSEKKPATSPAAPLLKEILEATFASREDRLQFVDRCLAASDSAMSHAWALRKLAERYQPEGENQLSQQSRARLREMLNEHIEKIAEAKAALRPLLDLVPKSQPRRLELPATWNAAAGSLFQAVQEQDSLVAALVAGTQTDLPKQTAFERFHQSYNDASILLEELKRIAP